MYPKTQYNKQVTLYTPIVCFDTQRMVYQHKVLQRCFWDVDSQLLRLPKYQPDVGGTVAPEFIQLHVPLVYNPGYVNRTMWIKSWGADLIEQPINWCLQVGNEIDRSLVFLGDQIFPQLSAILSIVEMEETIAELRRNEFYNVRDPNDVTEILFGPKSMHRLDVVL